MRTVDNRKMRREPGLLKEFGEYVKDQRQLKGMCLREVARAAGISATYLSQIERGEQRWPTEGIIVSLANALMHEQKDLMFRAGRLSAEVLEILKIYPQQYTAFLEATKDLSEEELNQALRLSLLTVRELIERKRLKRGRAGKPSDVALWRRVGRRLEKGCEGSERQSAQHLGPATP